MRTDNSGSQTGDNKLYELCGHRQPNGPYRCTKKLGHPSPLHGEHRVEGGGFAATWERDSDVVVDPALLQNATLPERMRAAADVLVEVSHRYGQVVGDVALTPWDAANLRLTADRWEAEEAAQGEQVQALSKALLSAGHTGVTVTAIARELVADGWTKREA